MAKEGVVFRAGGGGVGGTAIAITWTTFSPASQHHNSEIGANRVELPS